MGVKPRATRLRGVTPYMRFATKKKKKRKEKLTYNLTINKYFN